MTVQVNWSCIPFHELSLEELYDIMALRQEVFVVEQDCPYLDADGLDQEAFHLQGRVGQEKTLAAYVRILPKGVSYEKYASIGRVITSPKVRRQGVGIQLMETAIKKTKELYPEQGIKISAQCYLIDFYQSLGFKPTGPEYLEDNIPHIAMILS